MLDIEHYKIIEIGSQTYDVKNRFYVYQLCALNKQNRPKYRLVKQCSSKEKAQEYISQKTVSVAE